ncbi:MAG: hypothetical protein WCA46_16105 [Actinocatenispora sp.]
MVYRPPSAVSLFTGIATTVILVVGIVLLRHAAVGYLVFWCVALSAVTAFNLWAWFGSREG